MEESGDQSLREKLREQSTWKIIPAFLVTGLVIYFLVRYVDDTGDFLDVVREGRLRWLGAAVALETVNLYVMALRFDAALRSLGHRVHVGRLLDAAFATAPLAFVVPAKANDLLRAVVLRDVVPPLPCSGAILAERLIEAQTLCLLGMLGCALAGLWTWFLMLTALWVAFWALIWGLVKKPNQILKAPLVRRFREEGERVLLAFEALLKNQRAFWRTQGFATTVLLIHMASAWLLLWIFGADVSLMAVLALWPVAIFAGFLPLTVAGLGTRDAAFVALLVATGFLPGFDASVPAATFAYALVTLVLPALAGLPFMVRHIWKL